MDQIGDDTPKKITGHKRRGLSLKLLRCMVLDSRMEVQGKNLQILRIEFDAVGGDQELSYFGGATGFDIACDVDGRAEF